MATPPGQPAFEGGPGEGAGHQHGGGREGGCRSHVARSPVGRRTPRDRRRLPCKRSSKGAEKCLCTSDGTVAFVAERTRRIPEATVARLPEYVRLLVMLAEEGQHQAVGPAGRAGRRQRRQGAQGPVPPGHLWHPAGRLRRRLPAVPAPGAGAHRDRPVVVVGAGNLGRALANYEGFGERGFPSSVWSTSPGPGRHPGRCLPRCGRWPTCRSWPRATST